MGTIEHRLAGMTDEQQEALLFQLAERACLVTEHDPDEFEDENEEWAALCWCARPATTSLRFAASPCTAWDRGLDSGWFPSDLMKHCDAARATHLLFSSGRRSWRWCITRAMDREVMWGL
jgi:hypothetical protein